MNKPPTEPPFKAGDWIATAHDYSSQFAPEDGQRVWRATATPVRKEWGWATDEKSGVAAAHFRLATREDIAAEVDRLAGLIEKMAARRDALARAYVASAAKEAT